MMLFTSPQDTQQGPRPYPRDEGNNPEAPQPPLPGILAHLLNALNPGSLNHGDGVHTAEEFQRVLENLQQAHDFPTPSTQPVPQGTLEKLGKKKYKQGATEDVSCTICLADYDAEDEITTLPCKHSFHASPCLSSWFQRASSCPQCRFSIREWLESPESQAWGTSEQQQDVEQSRPRSHSRRSHQSESRHGRSQNSSRRYQPTPPSSSSHRSRHDDGLNGHQTRSHHDDSTASRVAGFLREMNPFRDRH